MAIFYRGSGIGTYWHLNDPIESGFAARAPGMTPTITRLMLHIARSTVNSPFISITRSYAVAWRYAMLSSVKVPTVNTPAYVHEIEIQEPLPKGLELLDPVKEVANTLPFPTSIGPPYQHDGFPDFLLALLIQVIWDIFWNNTRCSHHQVKALHVHLTLQLNWKRL